MDTNGDTKMILLKDLSSRLPYGIKVSINNSKNHSPVTVCEITRNYICVEGGGETCFSHGTYKPYLRTMSSMTEEERTEYFLLKHRDNDRDDNIILLDEAFTLIDWLNKHHFDYRGLIEKGLALEAPEGMYNIKTK